MEEMESILLQLFKLLKKNEDVYSFKLKQEKKSYYSVKGIEPDEYFLSPIKLKEEAYNVGLKVEGLYPFKKYSEFKSLTPLEKKISELNYSFVLRPMSPEDINQEQIRIQSISKRIKEEEPIPKKQPNKIEYLDTKEEELFKLNVKNFCSQLALIKIDSKTQMKKRNKIEQILNKAIGLTEDDNTTQELYNKMTYGDQKFFKLMMDLYDKVFFEGKWRKLSEEKGICFSICWNNRCYRKLGYCQTRGNRITINLSSKCLKGKVNLKDYTEEVEKGNTVLISGVKVDSVLKILLKTFEHELIHATISVFCSQFRGSNEGAVGTWTKRTAPKSGHGITFMSILNNVFGHTAYKLDILTPEKIIKKKVEAKKEEKEYVPSSPFSSPRPLPKELDPLKKIQQEIKKKPQC